MCNFKTGWNFSLVVIHVLVGILALFPGLAVRHLQFEILGEFRTASDELTRPGNEAIGIYRQY